MVGPIIESCQLITATTYSYTPPAVEGVESTAETWTFACIEAAHRISATVAALISFLYLLQ